jgi:aerobic-type carbon monoxide dehydrogenase small subunit (CoxS/CutS family)
MKRDRLNVRVNGEWVETSVVRDSYSSILFGRTSISLERRRGAVAGTAACVVLINGRARTTCNLPASKVEGQEITTIEGLAQGIIYIRFRRPLLRQGRFSVVLTPGMVLQAKDLLDHCAHPSR